MSQIARVAGVSRTTVSYVLNDVSGVNISPATRERVWEVARELNYQPDTVAQSLASGQVGAVALVLTQRPHLISEAFLSSVVSGLAAAVKPDGFHVLIEPLNPSHQEAAYGNLVRSRRADGIILVGPRPNDEEMERITADGIPLVLIGKVQSRAVPYVDVDNVEGARLAVEHLLQLDHRRIACVTNAPLIHPASQDRLDGYRRALEAAGVTYDPALVRYGAFTDESGAQAMEDLLRTLDDPPTAVFVASDLVALGVLSVLEAAGLSVPEDVALVGFDDIPLARFISPPLTTVRLPAYDLGYEAGEMMIHRLQQRLPGGEWQKLLNTELIVRRSCGGTETI
ncbi:MAG TPA: LacI family DNA-binding transcriptional regulator [Candidatus Sulfomarinibacteraceae bacterium]|nr:LacI family DNA-binding transcriptional regulator [Candidatus Sulfomarinibacteraceae bacterium]